MWNGERSPYSFEPKYPNRAKTWRLITDDFGEQEWHHRCPLCKRWLVIPKFYKSRNRPDGYCYECRKGYKKIRFSDEEYHRRILEERRLKYRLERNAKGCEVNPARGRGRLAYPVPKSPPRELLPAGPFLEWLQGKINTYGFVEVAARCGMSQRKLSTLLTKNYATVTFGTVDRILTHEESTLLWDLYPEEYEKMLDSAGHSS